FGARFSGEIPRPRADGKRHLRGERIQMVFPRARNAGRVFRVLPQAPCVLAHLRFPSAGRSFEKGVLQECAEAGAGNRSKGVSGMRGQEEVDSQRSTVEERRRNKAASPTGPMRWMLRSRMGIVGT